MYRFELPDVGEGIHEAEIINWLVKIGETVRLDQPMLEIQTDKALVEIPAPVAGTIADIKVKPGTVAQVGDVLVLIEPEGEAGPTSTTKKKRPAGATRPSPKVGIAGPGQRVLAAPAVRKMALEQGVDLNLVSGSGPAGRVLPSDLSQYLEQATLEPVARQPSSEVAPTIPPPATGATPAKTDTFPKVNVLAEAGAPGATATATPLDEPKPPIRPDAVEIEPLRGLRRRIAERMDEAWRIPHVTSFAEVEVSKLVKLKDALNYAAAGQIMPLTYMPFVIKAVVQALKEYPYFNASLDMTRQEITHHHYYHIGIATAVDEGLLVPVIRHADRVSLKELAQTIFDLSSQARIRSLGVDALSGSTFTITNFGSLGGEQGTPIINPPEVAILGMGRIEKKPVVVKGKVKARPILPLALSFDHRLVDGAAAAKFLGFIKTLLHDPNLLLLEL